MYSLNDDKVKIAIPVLHGKHDYRNWYEGIYRYLETKSLNSYIKYDVRKPQTLLEEPVKNDEFDKFLKLEITESEKLGIIPTNVKKELVKMKDIKHYDQSNAADCPDALLPLLEDSQIITTKLGTADTVFVLTKPDKLIKVMKKINEDTAKVFAIYHSTVKKAIYEVINFWLTNLKWTCLPNNKI